MLASVLKYAAPEELSAAARYSLQTILCGSYYSFFL